MSSDLATVRSFTRAFTRRVGVLEDRFLDRDRSLGASRLLWEIGHDGAVVGELRARLVLDSGYLSRLLRQLEADGLVTTSVDPADGRRRRVELTAAGVAEWAELETRSDRVAEQLLAPLGSRRAAELVELLARADRLLRAVDLRFETVDPADVEAVAALEAYFAELDERFDGGFDPGDTLTADAHHYRAPEGRFVLARVGEEVAGCGAVQLLDPGVAEVKRMWVAPGWRGHAVGGRLLAHLERVAVELGASTVRLDTNSALTEAITMYETRGYVDIPAYNDNPFARRWFEKVMAPDPT